VLLCHLAHKVDEGAAQWRYDTQHTAPAGLPIRPHENAAQGVLALEIANVPFSNFFACVTFHRSPMHADVCRLTVRTRQRRAVHRVGAGSGRAAGSHVRDERPRERMNDDL
jgi:hypothetical protein